ERRQRDPRRFPRPRHAGRDLRARSRRHRRLRGPPVAAPAGKGARRMNSLILRWSARYILGIALPFSIWILLRGHNAPGGGFIGGLIAASGLALYALSVGTREVRSIMRRAPKAYLGVGLLCAAASGLPGLLGAG